MLINLFHRRFLQLGVLFRLLTTATFVQAQTRWSDWNVYVFSDSDVYAGGKCPTVPENLINGFEEALIQNKCFASVLPRRDYAQSLSHCTNESEISKFSCLPRAADIYIEVKLDNDITSPSVSLNITAIKLSDLTKLDFQNISIERSELNNPDRRKSKMQELVEKLCFGKGISPTTNPSFLPSAEQAISPSPEQVIEDYYNLINKRQYTNARKKLSDRLKQQFLFRGFKKWWNSVKKVTPTEIKSVEGSDRTRRIHVQLSYWMNGKKGLSPKAPINKEFELSFDDRTKSWLIDKITKR